MTAQQSSLSCLVEKKKENKKNEVLRKGGCKKIMCLSTASTGTSIPFFPLCCHILFCQKFLSLFQSAGIKWCFITLDHLSDIEYLRTNDFQVLLLCVKNSTPRRALCQTSTQQLGLSTKGAPLCCWGERWQVPLRCGCLKIKRSSVVCRGPSVSVIASSRQLSGKLEGPN